MKYYQILKKKQLTTNMDILHLKIMEIKEALGKVVALVDLVLKAEVLILEIFLMIFLIEEVVEEIKVQE